MNAFWCKSEYLHNTALINADGIKVTYGDLYHRADIFAKDIPSRSLIFICAGNNIETLSAYLACLRHGHVCLLISHTIKPDMLESLVRIYEPGYIYKPADSGRYELESTGYAPVSMNRDLAVLLSTSGSTGSPKLVRLTKNNLQANALSIAEYLKLDSTERPVTNLPFYYSYGLSIVNSHLAVGATLLLTDESIIASTFWRFCDKYQFTSLAGVPYTYEMLEAVGFRTRSCPSLRYMTQAGGHMPAEKVALFASWAKEKDIRFFVMYGQTEATARMSYLPPQQATTHPDSIGVAIPGGAFSIDSPDGIEGELIYRGDNVCLGYAVNKEDLQLGDINKGVLHTGDLAKRADNGLYYITGRLKRFLKIAGNRFGLDELDAIFQGMGIEAACGGSDGKLLVAITAPEQKENVAKYLKTTWHLLRNQFKIVVVRQIPRSETGKILYSELFK